MDVTEIIPEKDSVRLLNAVLERIDYTKLYEAYSRQGRIEYSPKSLFKIVIYGGMCHIYHSRDLERACRRDINFMYLLGSLENVPDHNTIARFRSERLPNAIDDLMGQLVALLREGGEISGETIFVDGTKIEANANRYTFVWKKGVSKNESKMQEKMKKELPLLAAQHGIKFRVGERVKVQELKKLRKKLYALAQENGITFVHGTGKRKTALQRAIETVSEYLNRQKQYDDYNHSFEGRNSFSKTDRDATFMRMKEDHMLNGQLKPAYNVNIAVDSEYIVGTHISANCTDTRTLIPFMEEMKEYKYKKIIADAGYESEENYTYFEENGQIAFIKPANHEKAKTRKYKSDISRRENMVYDEKADTYQCHAGKLLKPVHTKKAKSDSGFPIEKTVYACENCGGCAHREKCISHRKDEALREDRIKRLEVSKKFIRQRNEMEERINTKEGTLLRMNRSIQVEGAFGILKQDMEYRRFLHRGKIKVRTEWLILCIAYNINKLHAKAQANRLGEYLHHPKSA
jgi:transposase